MGDVVRRLQACFEALPEQSFLERLENGGGAGGLGVRDSLDELSGLCRKK